MIGISGLFLSSIGSDAPGVYAQESPAAEKPNAKKPAAKKTSEKAADDDSPTIDPTSVNAACYICHTMFVFEPIAKIHFAEEVTCIECHGLSAAHANDEDIGATPPDITFDRPQINKMCRQCHKKHDVAPEKVVARWLKKGLKETKAVCTDCHGSHRIDRSAEESMLLPF